LALVESEVSSHKATSSPESPSNVSPDFMLKIFGSSSMNLMHICSHWGLDGHSSYFIEIKAVVIIHCMMMTDFLKFVGQSGQKITRTGNTAKYAGPGVGQNCLFVYFVLHRKCNWYAGTITVNSELDSASNDIYFLNMQLFP
jgi:hypothetical protein